MFLDFLRSLWQRLSAAIEAPNTQANQVQRHVLNMCAHLESGNWASLQSSFVFPLSYFLSVTLLSSGWRLVTTATGPLRSVGDPIVGIGWLFTTAHVPLQFSRANMTLVLHMTRSMKLLSLQLAPPAYAPWTAPAYACNGTRETSLTLLGRSLRRVHARITWPAETPKINKGVPCILLIGGSGPVDKDSTVGACKPFKDLALGLANRGIAVCRFDKYASTLLGKVFTRKQSVTVSDEYVYHVLDAVHQLRKIRGIDPSKIVLLGHSLGALVAARLMTLDRRLAGVVLMGTPGQAMYYRAAVRQYGYFEEMDCASDDTQGSEASREGTAVIRESSELRKRAAVADSDQLSLATPAKQLPFDIGPAYWLELREYEAMKNLEHVRAPVLILQGGRDYQTTVADDYAQYKSKFEGKRPNFTFQLYDSLNHLFIAGLDKERSSPMEYYRPGNVDGRVVDDIAVWMESNCAHKTGS